MAYRRRKNVLDYMANALTGIAAGFGRLGRTAKIIAVCAPCLIIAALVLVFAIPHNGSDPVLQASTSNVPVSVSDGVLPNPSGTPVPTTAPVVTPDPTLKKGDQNDKVTELQQRLMNLGYLDVDEATDLYGDATETAVKWFQRQMGIDQTGVADGTTQEWLFSDDAKHYTLLEDTSGSDVDSLQRQLKNLGYLGKVTGYYGSETVQAVKKFQQRNNLTADGKTGEQTLDLIYSPKAKPDPSVAAAMKSKVNVEQMISCATKQLGKPYISGNEGPNSFDCSGLVYYCLKTAGSKRGRYNAAGYAAVDDWPKITWGQRKRGDLMFFWDSSKGKIGHVAIYIGGGMMIDASSSNGKVVKRSANASWCKSEFKWARRPW